MPQQRRLTQAQKRIVAARCGWKCALCNDVLASTYQVDHIVPLWDGGEDTPEQCWALCVKCHAEKTQQEEIARVERKRRLRHAAAARGRPLLECAGCGEVVSPYFSHACRTVGWA